MSSNEFSDRYAARFGLPSMSCVEFDGFVQILERVAVKNKGFFIFKVGGERVGSIYAFVLSVSATKGVLIRKDACSIREGMVFLFCELERAGIYP
ncbi:hypothetical protein PRtIB026_A33330 [Pseudomonas sp. RtIB026]|uniref:hypothetical protein n=1 Tax=Pseudomonas sp. RtIB026 TaxID=2749999 RepID=UPI001943EDD5|nr:hypothetical protein [Pseudomonas sp. RtIB026]BCJ06922.1 hypothetical protein PRtIB026_A33330 [Pseudomonas sp. RtIB026]